MFSKLKSALDAFVMANVPPALPPSPGTSPTQRPSLTAGEVKWCDDMLPKFKLFREQAEAARGAKP